MILFFDTETTGKMNYRANCGDPSQPDLVQLAACLTDDTTDQIFGQINMIVKPIWKGAPNPYEFTIPEEAAEIHGINQEKALRYGIPRRTVLSAFNAMCLAADVIVAHNMAFDDAVMRTAYVRESVTHRLHHLEKHCSMLMATPILKLPKQFKKSNDPYKWPTLDECHRHFLGAGFDGAHNAMNDVMALIRFYREMRKTPEWIQDYVKP